MIVSCDHNESCLFNETMLLAKSQLILTNLALGTSANWRIPSIIIYDHKTFIVQATGGSINFMCDKRTVKMVDMLADSNLIKAWPAGR